MHLKTSDRRKIERRFREQGGAIDEVRRTGEVRYSHPSVPKPLTANGRRKDGCKKLLTLVNMLDREMTAECGLKSQRLDEAE